MPALADVLFIELGDDQLAQGNKGRRKQLHTSLNKSARSGGVAVMELLEKAIQLSVNRTPNIAYDQSRNVSEAEGAITGEILRSLAMLSDKILGRKGFSDNLKEAGTKAARPE